MFESFIEVTNLVAATDDGGDTSLLRFVGRLHPLLLHFPIALCISAAVVESVNLMRRKRSASEFAFAATGIAAGFAILAAFTGWFMADFEGAGPEATVFLHRWLGIISAGSLVIVFCCGLAGRTGRRIAALNGYRWGLILSAVLITVAAHFGGEMVWGEGYFTKVLFASKPAVPTTEEEPADGNKTPDQFATSVLPIFEARCVECHGPDKTKGDLRLDSAAAIFAGAKDTWVVTPGDAAASILIERVSYPIENPDVMPPKGETLTAQEIAAIAKWINDGALYDAAGEAKPEATETPKPTKPTLSAAFQDTVDALKARGVIVMAIAKDSASWEANASFANPPFDDAAALTLSPLAANLVWLNLARTKVTDAGMAAVATLGNVTNLRLDNTAVGDAGVTALLPLTKLETLNLYGTNVSDQGVESIATLPNLKKLYCGGSKTTAEGIEAIKAKFPGVVISGPAAAAPAAEEAKPTE